MFLAYLIQPVEEVRMTIYVMGVEGRAGQPLSRTKYPQNPKDLIGQTSSKLNLTPQDKRILMTLHMNQKLGSHTVTLFGSSGYAAITNMIDTGRCYLWPGQTKALSRVDKRTKRKLMWRTHENGHLEPRIQCGEHEQILPTQPLLMVDTNTGRCHTLDTKTPDAVSLLWFKRPSMALTESPAFIKSVLATYPQTKLPPPPHLKEQNLGKRPPVPVLTMRRAGPPKMQMAAHLSFAYGASEILRQQQNDEVLSIVDDVLLTCTRDRTEESTAVQTLLSMGFTPDEAPATDLFARASVVDCFALPTDLSLTQCLRQTIPALEKAGWRIAFGADCHLVAARDEDWYTDFSVGSHGRMALETGVLIDGQKVNLLPFMCSFLQERRAWTEEQLAAHLEHTDPMVSTPECLLVVPGARLWRMIRQLFELFSQDPLDKADHLRIDEWRATEVAQTLPEVQWVPPPELVNLLHALQGDLTVMPRTDCPGLRGTLREYQQYGLGWLSFLREHGLGGILADDMGLGKTLQTIALLQQEKNEGRLELPALIVAPTSVLPNWRHELNRFAPGLKCLLFTGVNRHKAAHTLDGQDVIITSYGLVHRDHELYANRVFSFVILDEAQAIKNPKAKVSRAAFQLKGRMRLCLTGTPIQNNLGELWSLMHFALPGLLGTHDTFRKTFQYPIERDNHPVVLNLLQQRIRPLILRRTKAVVASELPEKTEIIQTLAISEAQQDLYHTIRMAMTTRIRDEMDAKGLARSHIVVLDALLKLRQICCDPRLRDTEGIYHLPEDSCKLAWLADALPEMLAEGRRILLFSQFTSMLDLIKDLCHQLKLPYVELRGTTRDRDTPVRQFQDEKVPLFLISLKAGGTGLNLTAADTVIHYDPWWNPAVELQATDRAHRIGQTKPVFVYKLVVEGTVEERVIALQQKKKDLFDLIEKNNGRSMVFSAEDIEELLAPVGS